MPLTKKFNILKKILFNVKNLTKISIISCLILLIIALPGTATFIDSTSKFPEGTLYPSESVDLEFYIRDISSGEKLELNTQLIDPIWNIEIKDDGKTVLLGGKGLDTFTLPKLDCETITVHLSGKTPVNVSDKTLSLIFIVDKESGRVIDSRVSKVYGTSSILQIVYENDGATKEMRLTAETIEKDGIDVTNIKNRLNEANRLNAEANNFYSKGDFLSAKKNLQNVEEIISDTQAMLKNAESERQSLIEENRQKKARNQAIISIVAVLVIIIIIVALYIRNNRRKRAPPRRKL